MTKQTDPHVHTHTQLSYNIVLVSCGQKSDSVIYVCIYICVCLYINLFLFRLFSIIGYYKILNIVPCAIQ